ncbi:MAG: Quercetin 2,3-dioxygenase [Chloroflexi bacterium ADurb.Bin325]|nr:MAG: Quercetin 2,3-dioxygenase [Chloroflexi bacterium ADurb.Bin325]
MTEQIRSVVTTIIPQAVMEGAGVRLKRSFPSRTLDFLDPFLLFDHFGSDNPADYMAGFPMHPHRGIETVTYMLAGAVSHKDSLGNAGTISTGDVQWMSAGGGILHEEMPQRGETDRMEGFQLWVNLPARLKMMHPRYRGITAEMIPNVVGPDGTVVRVIAGEYNGTRGPAVEIAADPTYLDVSVPAGGAFRQPVQRGHTALAYVFEGAGTFGDSATLTPYRFLVFSDGDAVTARAGAEGLRFLLMTGRPTGDAIVRYGPFVMNTREEILQALADLHDGTFVKGE